MGCVQQHNFDDCHVKESITIVCVIFFSLIWPSESAWVLPKRMISVVAEQRITTVYALYFIQYPVDPSHCSCQAPGR